VVGGGDGGDGVVGSVVVVPSVLSVRSSIQGMINKPGSIGVVV